MTNQLQSTKRAKPTRKSAKRRHYDKPLSLYPLTADEVLTVLLHTPPMKDSKKKRKRVKDKAQRKKVDAGG